MNNSRPPAILLKGPTASGKTALAVALAARLPVEIISVDSALVYRGMDIGTAKPSAEVLAQAPHHLIDICPPSEIYSAARFRQDALRLMAAVVARERIPLLVGGTMLYFRALEQGLSRLPEADARVRQRLEHELRRRGLAALHARLSRVDPVQAARIHPNDPQRTLRALEVFELTGRPMSAWLAEQSDQAPPYRFIKLALLPADRARLHAVIERRFQRMLVQGLVGEVESLLRLPGVHRDLPSMRSVGYRQVCQYLAGELPRERLAQAGIVATRRLAKRQLTWLRGEAGLRSFDAQASRLVEQVLKHLSGAL